MIRSMSTTNICLILLNVLASVYSIPMPCHFYESINITSGIWKQSEVQNRSSIVFGGIEFPRNTYAMFDYTEDDGMKNVTAPHLRGCFCKVKPCRRLCCSNEQLTINTIKNLEDKCKMELNQIKFEVYQENEEIFNLPLESTIIKTGNKTCLPFFVQEDYLNVGNPKQLNQAEQILNAGTYCQTRIDRDTKIHMNVSICVAFDDASNQNVSVDDPEPYAVLDRMEQIGMITSMPFVIVTLLLYIWLPALHRNLHGKCFICYLICQLAYYTSEFIAYYITSDSNLDFVIIYLFLCSFQWLNVTAFDAWRNLRGFNVSKPSKSDERKRLVVYMLYALLSPFLYYTYDFLPDIFKPKAKASREQVEDLMRGIFIGVSFTLNIVFFILTTLKIRKVRNEMDSLTGQDDSSRHQKKMGSARGSYHLYCRLFILMGLLHSIAALSYLISGSSTFTEWAEIFMSLQGVWIFLLFVLKRHVFNLAKERWTGTESISTT